MRPVGLVFSAACILACAQPAQAPKSVASAASSGAAPAPPPTPFRGRFPQDCEHWPYDESLKGELVEKAVALLEGLQGTRSKALLERIHPGGLHMVQILVDPESGKDDKRETLVTRTEILQHFAEGGGAWLLDRFIDPVRNFRRPKVGAHWDVLDEHRQLCVAITGTEGLFDGKTYVVLNPTDKEETEGRNNPVVVLFDRDSAGTWLAVAVVRPSRALD